MNQNVNNEVEVEESYNEFFGIDEEYSQEYLDFINSLEVAPVSFDANDIIDDFTSIPYQENWWDEDEYVDFESLIEDDNSYDEVNYNSNYLNAPLPNDFNFPQPEPKYFKVSPFELIPQKKYLTF